jgi:hypothetical protein
MLDPGPVGYVDVVTTPTQIAYLSRQAYQLHEANAFSSMLVVWVFEMLGELSGVTNEVFAKQQFDLQKANEFAADLVVWVFDILGGVPEEPKCVFEMGTQTEFTMDRLENVEAAVVSLTSLLEENYEESMERCRYIDELELQLEQSNER